jgi:hypothetical protein
MAIAYLSKIGASSPRLLGRYAVLKLSGHTVGKCWLWMFSRFLGGSKQLKPPYKQGGDRQNALHCIYKRAVWTPTGYAGKDRASLRVQAECPRNVPVESPSVPNGAYLLLWDGGSCHLF